MVLIGVRNSATTPDVFTLDFLANVAGFLFKIIQIITYWLSFISDKENLRYEKTYMKVWSASKERYNQMIVADRQRLDQTINK